MVTLREILQLNYTITLLKLDVRQPDLKLTEQVVIGKDYHPTVHQLGRKEFQYIDADINFHGRPNKRGFPEIAFDVDFKAIPKDYLDMEVKMIHLLTDRFGTGKGMMIWADVVPIQMRIK